MNTRILNRQGQLPADGWYHIEANGEHVNHEARVVQVVDDKARAAIANRFERDAAAEHFAGMLVDKDHLGKSLENPTEALGWGMQVQNRAGELMAKIDWTSLGAPLVESKDGRPAVYKFFSTEYDPADCEKIGTRIINRRVYDVVRPLRLDGLSLTNDPNNKGQRPISNRKSAATVDREETKTMKTLLKKMGLAEDASEESAVAAYDTISNRATKAEGQVTTLTTERDLLLKDQVESDLEKYKNRIKPDNVEKVRAQLIKNRAPTIELLESMADEGGNEDEGDEKRRPITNRRTAAAPGGGQGANRDAKAEAEEKRAAKIQNRARELRSADPKLGLSKSYEQAESEVAATEAK